MLVSVLALATPVCLAAEAVDLASSRKQTACFQEPETVLPIDPPELDDVFNEPFSLMQAVRPDPQQAHRKSPVLTSIDPKSRTYRSTMLSAATQPLSEKNSTSRPQKTAAIAKVTATSIVWFLICALTSVVIIAWVVFCCVLSRLPSTSSADSIEEEDDSNDAFKVPKDQGALRPFGVSGGTLVEEYRMRSKHWLSDWTDGWSSHTIPAALFMFFATFTSTLALGQHVHEATNGTMGVPEYLMMNSVAGVLYCLVGSQPLVVLRPTGPITLILITLYQFSQAQSLPFFPFLACTGIFVGVLMFLVAACELSRYIDNLTLFGKDVFACFVCSIYIWDGLSGVAALFKKYPNEGAKCLLSFNYTLIIVVLALWFSHAPHSRLFTARIRELLAEYALSLSILLVMVFSPLCTFRKTFTIHMDESKHEGEWFQSSARPLFPDMSLLGHKGVLLAAMMAVPITVFFYCDQNISSLLCQKPHMGLRKGSYFHSSLACMGALNVMGTMFGLPFVTGSIPHSPQFVLALSDLDPQSSETLYVSEQRVAPVLMYALMMLPLLTPEVLGKIPVAAVHGTLIFVGVQGLFDTQLFERLILLATDPALYPSEPTYTNARPLKMHLFTFLQVLCWMATWAANILLGIAFPLWVICLVPIRWYGLPLMFTQAELADLDNEENEAHVSKALQSWHFMRQTSRSEGSDSLSAHVFARKHKPSYQRP